MSVKRIYELPFGAIMQRDGAVRFRIWAPAHQRIELRLAHTRQALPMLPFDQGWHELVTYDAKVGTLYQFALPNGSSVPDPASRFQPKGVHGASEVIDPTAYEWHDTAWQGRAWEGAVIYELHLGTFTPQGTFRAAIDKLDHLVELGITALEIMPIAAFPGRRNWGYDGVLLYAPDESYGRPEDFKALIDAAHARGLMVILDVVYNHFGPDGNYLSSYAPQFFTEAHHTPWGAAINYDNAQCHTVREFMIQNALYWLQEYHLDGLRLDAVHAIIDDSQKSILAELAERVRVNVTNRHIHLLVENEDNIASLLTRESESPFKPRLYTAQWNDDVHHVLHTAATCESGGYYQDYLGDTDKLGRALAEGFVFQGELMPFRGSPRGEPSTHLPPSAFVAFIQNHDQIGNRAFGERLSSLTDENALHAIAAVYLLLPQTPMLFMGEEWGARTPFLFFCDFDGELAAAVRKGRREEFARFPEFQDPGKRKRIPDPQADATFIASKLNWNELIEPEHAAWLQCYRRILKVRQQCIVPLLEHITRAGSYAVLAPGCVSVQWLAGTHRLQLVANLSSEVVNAAANAVEANSPVNQSFLKFDRLLWMEGTVTEQTISPWSVRWSLADINRVQ